MPHDIEHRWVSRLSVVLSVAALAWTASAAHAATRGSAEARIDWSSVLLEPSAGTSFSVFDRYAFVQNVVDYDSLHVVSHDAQDHGNPQPDVSVSDVGAPGGRSYSLLSRIDLAHALVQSSAVSAVHVAGHQFDIADNSRWIYILPSGDATFHLQASYQLRIDGEALPGGDPLGFSEMSAYASLAVFDEQLGRFYVNDVATLVDQIDTSVPTAVVHRVLPGRFDETVTLVPDRLYRFEVGTTSTVNGFAPAIPEPTSGALLLLGLPVLGAMGRRRTGSRRG
jgi:opacity protein-like surface antigen